MSTPLCPDRSGPAGLPGPAVIGAVILAVARTAYPEPSMVDDPDRMAVFTTQAGECRDNGGSELGLTS